MQNELDIVRDVSKRLDSADIGYMLTGSIAMNRTMANHSLRILRAESAAQALRAGLRGLVGGSRAGAWTTATRNRFSLPRERRVRSRTVAFPLQSSFPRPRTF